ncbi:MAG TPA: hypothetical protein PLZ16_11830, partial [Gammaproteobacteria bacterium]|nr:hypothetical protein [Gammaproteobacteria bacterium]
DFVQLCDIDNERTLQLDAELSTLSLEPGEDRAIIRLRSFTTTISTAEPRTDRFFPTETQASSRSRSIMSGTSLNPPQTVLLSELRGCR